MGEASFDPFRGIRTKSTNSGFPLTSYTAYKSIFKKVIFTSDASVRRLACYSEGIVTNWPSFLQEGAMGQLVLAIAGD